MRLQLLTICCSKAPSHNKHIRRLPPIHIGLLLRQSCFHLTSSAIRTARWYHTAKDQKDVPQQKGDEFVRVAASVVLVRLLETGRIITAACAVDRATHASAIGTSTIPKSGR
jgi:hypothetical protein